MKFKIIPNEQTPKVEKITTDNDILFVRDKKMIIKFLSFARRQQNCIGLAANQISLDDMRIMKRFFAIRINHFWDIIIEPEIIEYIEMGAEQKETCLTWIGRLILAKRFYKIKVKYFNLDGYLIEKHIQGLEAQIWQHEYNHLQGIEEKFIEKDGK